MPKSFLFTHRRYNASPTPNDDSSASSERTVTYATTFPPSPDKADLLQSPGRPQAARTTAAAATSATSVAINGSNGRNLIPEEMYNLLQLAEVSLAASATGASSVLDRWHQRQQQHYRRHHHQLELVRAVLAAPLVTTSMDKPLDLSIDPSSSASGNSGGAQVRILTPSPSPTPSSTTEESHHHLTMSLGLRKNGRGPRQSTPQRQRTDSAAVDLMTDDEVGEDSSTCWSPSADEADASVEDTIVVMHKSSKNSSINSKASSPTSSSSSSSTGSDNNSHSGDGHECPDCGKRYSTSSNLARHRQTHRSPADQKARRCPHCDKVYVSVPAFSMHVRTHSQGCKCPYCGKSFSRPWLLQGHIRTHTGEKPFCCQICDKAFADKSNLRAHVQTHSNLKPFTCQRCGKAFALKSYLYKHEESSCMKVSSSSSPLNNGINSSSSLKTKDDQLKSII